MASGLTNKSSEMLTKFVDLDFEEKQWFLKTALDSLDSSFVEDLLEKMGLELAADTAVLPDYSLAKQILLDETNLDTGEKVLFAAFYIQDLFDLPSGFTGRQVTETLKETGNQVSNITAALSGLQQKNLIKSEKLGSSKQSQRTYSFTDEGLKHTKEIIISMSDRATSLSTGEAMKR